MRIRQCVVMKAMLKGSIVTNVIASLFIIDTQQKKPDSHLTEEGIYKVYCIFKMKYYCPKMMKQNTDKWNNMDAT